MTVKRVLYVAAASLAITSGCVCMSSQSAAAYTHQAYGDGGCTAATAAQMGDCVRRLFADPKSPYGLHHVHTSGESAPAPSPRMAGDPAQAGVWRVVADAVVNGKKVRAIHVSLMKSGRVLVTAGSGNDPNNFAAGTFLSFVWDVSANTMTQIPTPKDVFCSGHMHLPDGRLLFFGGTNSYPTATKNFTGSNSAYTFDETTDSYAPLPPMEVARWYPRGVADANGNAIVAGGADQNGQLTPVNERYNVAANQWEQLGIHAFPLYPQIVLAGNGQLFYTGVNVFGRAGVAPGLWQPDSNAWQPVDGLPQIDCRDQGTGLFLYPAQNQKFMVIAGGCEQGTTNSTAIADLTTNQPVFTAGPPLPFAAMHVCGLNLPDGSVFVSGGGDHNVNPVLRAALLRPGATTWEEVASPSVGRMYHSTCILMPDGAVLTLGTDLGPDSETRIERYEPWYMTRPRPAITGPVGTFALGHSYTVGYTSANGAREAMLIKPSSVTHSSDPNQRAVKVPVTVQPNGQLSMAIEANPAILPPAFYMLFLLDNNGVPSQARWVQVTH